MTHQNSQKELATLNRLGPHGAAQATKKYIVFDSQPQRSVRLFSNDGRLDLRAARDDDGSISITDPSLDRGYLALPDPRGNNPQEYRRLGMANLVQNAASHHTAHLALQKEPLPGTDPKDTRMKDAISQWIRQMPNSLADRIMGYAQLQQFTDVLRKLLDPEAYELARDHDGKVPLSRYNRAVRSVSALQQLQHTNPGVANWYLAENHHQVQSFQHPGEIIREIKRRVRKAGVEDRHWRTIVNLDPRNTQALTSRQINRHIAATIVNAMGENNSQPDVAAIHQAVFILRVYTYRSPAASPPKADEDPITSRTRRRIRQLAQTILREDPACPTSQRSANNSHTNTDIILLDYIKYQLTNDRDITPTTYTGLLKAAHRWHQREQQAQMAREIQRQIDRTNGWFECWNSLVDHLDIPDPQNPGAPPIRALALTSTQQLLAESRAMNHCVAAYAEASASGRSRIFSLRQGSTTLATTELQYRNGTWQATQTQGPANHAASDPATRAAARLAQAYQEHWDASPEPRHLHWEQNQHTNATRPTRQD